jgi:hypothetical protein
MMAIVIGATGMLLPLVWRIGDWFVGAAEQRIAAREDARALAHSAT